MSSALWDIDTLDWQLPGPDRGRAARIISELARRGYQLVTVSRLPGEKMVPAP